MNSLPESADVFAVRGRDGERTGERRDEFRDAVQRAEDAPSGIEFGERLAVRSFDGPVATAKVELLREDESRFLGSGFDDGELPGDIVGLSRIDVEDGIAIRILERERRFSARDPSFGGEHRFAVRVVHP